MRHNWKALIALLLVAAMALTGLAGCGAKTDAAGTDAAGTDAAKKLKVALILPGKKDDVSFNQAMYEGVTAYAEAHADTIDLKVVENVYEVADIEPALSDFADQGYDVIFGHGFQFMEPLVAVADKNPEGNMLMGAVAGFAVNTFAFGACFADVEVDVPLGKVIIQKIVV